MDDFSTIAMEATELSKKTIHKRIIHVGESVKQKNIVSALRSVLERDKVLYHANAWSEDRKSIYIVSKQVASMAPDEKTHHT